MAWQAQKPTSLPRQVSRTVALCGSCYCMTKRTCCGTCAKCGAKKPSHAVASTHEDPR